MSTTGGGRPGGRAEGWKQWPHWGLILYKDLLKTQLSAASSAEDRTATQPPLPPSKDLQSVSQEGRSRV